MEWVNLAAFVLFLLFFVVLVIQVFRLRITNKSLFTLAAQAEIDKKALLVAIERLQAEKDQKPVEQTDGFLRFISESRDAAFTYIEEVQDAISSFDEKVGPVIQQYRETGKVKGIKVSDLVKDLTESYDKLMEAMPQEKKDV